MGGSTTLGAFKDAAAAGGGTEAPADGCRGLARFDSVSGLSSRLFPASRASSMGRFRDVSFDEGRASGRGFAGNFCCRARIKTFVVSVLITC